MKLATIEIIQDVYPHPNAERLEFVKVCGYDCIVPKDKYKVGDFCILIQPDTVLPEKQWSEFYRKMSSKRVRASKIRGEWSFGIVEGIDLLINEYGYSGVFEAGIEVSSLMDVVKYDPPVPQDLSAKGGLPYQMPKTDEERYQNLDLSLFYGMTVNVTQKIDGQSFTAYAKDGEFGVCGRTYEIKTESQNRYTAHISRYNLREKLLAYSTKYGVNLALRGESYGNGIQNFGHNVHSKQKHGVMFFSVWLIDKMEYALRGHSHNVFNVCKELDLPAVPLLEKDVVLTPELIQHYANLDKLNGEYFEGVVIDTGTKTFKVINLNYDSRK